MQGKTGNPFFDCVGMNSGAVPFKSFVQANGNNAQTLANHFVSYLKGDLSTPVLSQPLQVHPENCSTRSMSSQKCGKVISAC